MEICPLALACVQLSTFISLSISIIYCLGTIASFITSQGPVRQERLCWVQLTGEIINKKENIKWLTPLIRKGMFSLQKRLKCFFNSKSTNYINQ